MIVAGIDYSLTSPSICVIDADIWQFDKCEFYYIVKKEKNVVTDGRQFFGTVYPEYLCDAHRYDNLTNWSLDILMDSHVEKVFMEGYAFNAVGRIFQIAENTGMLKHSMWKNKIPYDVFPPSLIKKFATTKGNANKEAMYESFLEETGIDIRKKLDIRSEKQWNPLSDIVDAYYIAKCGFMSITEKVVDI